MCELFADGEAGIADLADEIIPAGDELDDLIFDQADFAKAILNFRRSAKLLDPNRHTALHAAQGADVTTRFRCGSGMRRCVAHGVKCRRREIQRLARACDLLC